MIPRLVFSALVFASLASRPAGAAARHRTPRPETASPALVPAPPGAPPARGR